MKTSLYVYKELFKRDMLIFWREYPGKFLDTFLLFFTTVIVFAYFMPKEGLSQNYGPFLLVGAIASFGLFDVVGKVAVMIMDLEGNKTISYFLTLPIRSWTIFCYRGIMWAISSTLMSLLLFPIGKLLLYNRFDLSVISYGKLTLIYLTANLFFGFFALWITSLLKGTGNLGSIYFRIINPLFMFGAYFYAWKKIYALSETVALITLANPMVYVMEGMRAATLGQKGYLPFWLCLFVVWGFILFFSLNGINRLKKRLDCV